MNVRSRVSLALALLLGTLAGGARAQNVLVLTDNSPSTVNADTHVSDLIAAFTNTGASITTNTTELTNGSAMAAALVTGWDAVVVVTVAGPTVDVVDVPVLQSAVTSQASRAFLFFTDSCFGCTTSSTNALLPITNGVGSWAATLGPSDNTYPYSATLNGSGSYIAAFSGLPSILGGAYAPLLGVPVANVLYDADAAVDGPMAVVAASREGSACVYHATDTSQFWKTGGVITAAQADALAAAYLDAALGSASPCGEPVAVTPASWSAAKRVYR